VDALLGTQQIQKLIADGLHAVTRYRPQSDKVIRPHAQTAMIENGFVHVPEQAPWLAPYLAELTAFPNGKHDNQVDSTAQMLDWFKGADREPGRFYGYYRIFAKELPDRQTVKPAPLPAGGFRRW
jgi:phage terminase large subunit-like protein